VEIAMPMRRNVARLSMFLDFEGGEFWRSDDDESVIWFSDWSLVWFLWISSELIFVLFVVFFFLLLFFVITVAFAHSEYSVYVFVFVLFDWIEWKMERELMWIVMHENWLYNRSNVRAIGAFSLLYFIFKFEVSHFSNYIFYSFLILMGWVIHSTSNESQGSSTWLLVTFSCLTRYNILFCAQKMSIIDGLYKSYSYYSMLFARCSNGIGNRLACVDQY
jgi:hypothetical protein